jgi:Asp-tRNA(Asn)/Glu-tRNA(Gln) amidotransferase A subunit family amidase
VSSELARRWSLTETVCGLRAGQITPRDLLDRALAGIAEAEPQVLAWVRVEADAAIQQADGIRVDPGRGPLAGVPLGVKDIIDVAGLPTGCGSTLRSAAPPAAADAAVVRQLRSRGAIPLGKTVTTEFAYFSPGPTRNPADPEHTPGGSSSGSAAAVAAGMVPLALGTQTAGSLTRPAAFCGVAGLVLTTGTVPADGITGLSPSLDTVGLLAATVGDLRTAWAATLAGEPALRRALQARAITGASAAPRVLLWHPRGLGDVDPAMQDALELAAGRLGAAGAKMTPLDWDGPIGALVDDHATVMAYEAARERSAELDRAEELSEPLAELLRRGAATPHADYHTARQQITQAGRYAAALLDRHDAVLGPAALGPAPEGLTATGSPVLSRPWQALGLPVVTVPGLRNRQGLPLGLQLIGRRNDEERLLALAAVLEQRITD